MHWARPQHQCRASNPDGQSCRLSPTPPATLLLFHRGAYRPMEKWERVKSCIPLDVQRPPKSPGGVAWRTSRLKVEGLQSWLHTLDTQIEIVHSRQPASWPRIATKVSVQKAPSDVSAQTWRERIGSFWVQGEAAFYKYSQYIAYNLANPSSIKGSTVGIERGQNEGQQKFPLKK